MLKAMRLTCGYRNTTLMLMLSNSGRFIGTTAITASRLIQLHAHLSWIPCMCILKLCIAGIADNLMIITWRLWIGLRVGTLPIHAC